ncbi:MAG: solanesyl diphosphate synthase [Gloeomargaritaceae cyanobacterium C42_A2020_066]|nr:solanesyl diphosphate synthase [Gloeomargaritaceae cyanobacterium C42_A2020_066]
MTLATSLFAPVEADLRILRDNLRQLVGAQHPVLRAAAEYLFGAGGKQLRPALVLLAGRATVKGSDLTPRHRRLAEITEMIHTASLVHDDLIDQSDTRRGVPTVHSYFGGQVAVLAGDFLFAQASWYLANLDNLEVVKLLSKVITDFAEGEIRQSLMAYDTSITLEDYLEKSFYKTASLMAGSLKAAGLLSDLSSPEADQLYSFGKHFGIAFQVVDDILDFTATAETLGKPTGSDLMGGTLTAPALFALREQPELRVLIGRKLEEPGDLEAALGFVHRSSGLERAWALATDYTRQAVEALAVLSPSPARQALIDLTDYNLSRRY